MGGEVGPPVVEFGRRGRHALGRGATGHAGLLRLLLPVPTGMSLADPIAVLLPEMGRGSGYEQAGHQEGDQDRRDVPSLATHPFPLAGKRRTKHGLVSCTTSRHWSRAVYRISDVRIVRFGSPRWVGGPPRSLSGSILLGSRFERALGLNSGSCEVQRDNASKSGATECRLWKKRSRSAPESGRSDRDRDGQGEPAGPSR